MAQQLTKQGRVDAEKQRISQLTNPHEQHFKVIFSHQLEQQFDFGLLHRRRSQHRLDDTAIIKIFRALGKFMDDSVRLSISEVETKYKRPTDNSDGTYDPETGTKVQVEHLCLYPSDATPDGAGDSVRVHGYFRNNGGYFVVTKLDWYHAIHG